MRNRNQYRETKEWSDAFNRFLTDLMSDRAKSTKHPLSEGVVKSLSLKAMDSADWLCFVNDSLADGYLDGDDVDYISGSEHYDMQDYKGFELNDFEER